METASKFLIACRLKIFQTESSIVVIRLEVKFFKYYGLLHAGFLQSELVMKGWEKKVVYMNTASNLEAAFYSLSYI